MKDYSDLITLLRTEDGGGVVDYDAVMEAAADAIEDLSEQVQPRMLDGTDYKVTQSVWVGDREVIMAERPKYGEGDKFLCSLYENNGVMGCYTECMVSDDIMEIFDLYAHRILDQMQKVRETISLPEGMDNDLILSGDDRVAADDYKQSIRDKVVVIKPETISPEYYAATSQLWLCTGGFGSSASPRGRTCFCINLHDTGRQESFYRSDIMGTVDPEHLPNWAKVGLRSIQQAEKGAGKPSLSSQIQTAEKRTEQQPDKTTPSPEKGRQL